MLVFVLNKFKKPLMPCKPAIARRLLNDGLAKPVRNEPFTIQLLYGSSGYTQDVTVGVDVGAKTIGTAAVSHETVVYAAEISPRDDISSKMQKRAKYRRTRRSRKTKYRPARFSNRRRKEGWLTPTLRSKLHSHVKEIEFIKKILPVKHIVIETASFDIHKISNPEVTNYQNGPQKGFYNIRQYVLNRDGYCCQSCKGSKKDPHLEVHHIIFKSNNGSDAPDNLVTLCKTCHKNLHADLAAVKKSLKFKKATKNSPKEATHVSTISAYLLKQYPEAQETFGYETKFKRQQLGLKKEHWIDAAVATLKEGDSLKFNSVVYPKKCIPKGGYQHRWGARSEKTYPSGRVQGFKRYDKVLWKGEQYFIKGLMSNGYAKLMKGDMKKIKHKPMPKLSELVRISARKTWIIFQKAITNII